MQIEAESRKLEPITLHLKSSSPCTKLPRADESGDESTSDELAASDGLQSTRPKTRLTLSYAIEDYVHPAAGRVAEMKSSFNWTSILAQPGVVTPPVPNFKHAPLAALWDHIVVGMKVEVENSVRSVEAKSGHTVTQTYWVASILRLAGYYALLRFEGFGQDSSKDFWMHICSERMRPVGWCCTRGKSLVPPRHIQNKFADWKDFLVKRLTGARTTPQGFYSRVLAHVQSLFRVGMKVELVDKMKICQMRVATVKAVVGHRLHLVYDDPGDGDPNFWCHEHSQLIHHVGWSRNVGHQIQANDAYHSRCEAAALINDVDTTADMFPHVSTIEQTTGRISHLRQTETHSDAPYSPTSVGGFVVGMKMEAVDPLNLESISVATVMRVLRFGYIMLRIDGYETDEAGSDWFCCHSSSPLLLPVGFCRRHSIPLRTPSDIIQSANQSDNEDLFVSERQPFDWDAYLAETGSQAAPLGLFRLHEDSMIDGCSVVPQHGFKVGMKLEASDQMDPRLICVATVVRVVGSRLIRVHFDGWSDSYDQWMDCQSVDIYPAGWTELVGHRLEAPLRQPSQGKRHESVKKRPSSTPQQSQQSQSAQATRSSSRARSKRVKRNSSGSDSGRSADGSIQRTDGLVDSSFQPSSPSTKSIAVIKPRQHECEADSKANSDDEPYIPRLVNVGEDDSVCVAHANCPTDLQRIVISQWSADHLGQFFEVNDCSSVVEQFRENDVDGQKFVSDIRKADIMRIVGNKIGPCLKVEHLLDLLKTQIRRQN